MGAAALAAKPGYDSFRVFLVLREFLQPDARVSLESTLQNIFDLLLKDAQNSATVRDFAAACFKIAGQIPYHHPAHQKFARFLEDFGFSAKVTEKPSPTGIMEHDRYQVPGEEMRDQYDASSEENWSEYVSYHAFVANLFVYHIFPTDPILAIWAFRDGLETNLDKEKDCIRDAHILGAAQWILWNGHGLFMQLPCPEYEHARNKSPSQWAGELYPGKAGLSVHRWAFWRECFAEMQQKRCQTLVMSAKV